MTIGFIIYRLAELYVYSAIFVFILFMCKNLRKSKRNYIAGMLQRGNLKAVNQVLRFPPIFYFAYTVCSLVMAMIWPFRLKFAKELLKF